MRAALATRQDEAGVGSAVARPLEAGASLALYIHWPFCVRRCPYCDFNAHVRPEVDAARHGCALLAELSYEREATGPMRLGSIFFGGGTPSLMPPRLVGELVAEAKRLWPPLPDVEVTLEANPSSVEAGRFAQLAAAGVNRLSLGVQSLDNEALKLLGRPHNAAEARAALELAQTHFSRVSADLIHSRPGQTLAGWRAELRQLLGHGVGHLSAYQLTFEPGTRFYRLRAMGALVEPDDETQLAMLEATEDEAAAAGLALYEVSNFARTGERSRHNLAYWRYRPFVGVGAGAHGRRVGLATRRVARPEAWLHQVEARGHGLEASEPVDRATAAREALVMGLRLADGLDPDHFAAATGVALDEVIDASARARLEALGLLRRGWPLAVTPAGRRLVDRLLVELWRPCAVFGPDGQPRGDASKETAR